MFEQLRELFCRQKQNEKQLFEKKIILVEVERERTTEFFFNETWQNNFFKNVKILELLTSTVDPFFPRISNAKRFELFWREEVIFVSRDRQFR